MARTARKPKDDDGGEIKAKDFARAAKLYREDIKKAVSEASSQNQFAGEAYKVIRKQCHIQPDAARKAFKLMDGTEDAMRDDWFRGFVGLVNELAGQEVLTFHSNDLVDQMGASDNYKRPDLSIVTMSNGEETDLADAAGDDEDQED